MTTAIIPENLVVMSASQVVATQPHAQQAGLRNYLTMVAHRESVIWRPAVPPKQSTIVWYAAATAVKTHKANVMVDVDDLAALPPGVRVILTCDTSVPSSVCVVTFLFTLTLSYRLCCTKTCLWLLCKWQNLILEAIHKEWWVKLNSPSILLTATFWLVIL